MGVVLSQVAQEREAWKLAGAKGLTQLLSLAPQTSQGSFGLLCGR
jgi:hypothetical protein